MSTGVNVRAGVSGVAGLADLAGVDGVSGVAASGVAASPELVASSGLAASPDWWKNAVIYQVYPKSFADSTAEGVGDLAGICDKLGYLQDLGVDAIWISPFYPSPQLDGGYDIIDYCNIDPVFGSLDDADRLIGEAHVRGIRVIIDLVPNHCSWLNPLFKEALAAAPGSPERDMFIFKDGRGPGGLEPPTDWVSGAISAWTKVPNWGTDDPALIAEKVERFVFGGGDDGGDSEAAGGGGTGGDGDAGTSSDSDASEIAQWYLHLFDISQPDWNWENPKVWDMFDQVLRFWLDRGVDGFRVDVSHGLKKDPRWQDWNGLSFGLIPTDDPETRPPFWDQDPVHDVYRHWRKVLDEYGPDRIMVAEAWLSSARLSRYVRSDEMNQAFNFAYLETPWDADKLKETIISTLAANASVGAPTTWVLSNHDVIRHATRFGYDAGTKLPFGIGPNDPQPDEALGLRRARAATLVMLALPGSAYMYQGEELGLPEDINMADAERQDPHWVRSGGKLRGRDGCRAPMPWNSEQENLGFSTGKPWISLPKEYATLAVDRQESISGSTLELYRQAIALRRKFDMGGSRFSWIEGVPAGILAFRVGSSSAGVEGVEGVAGVEGVGGVAGVEGAAGVADVDGIAGVEGVKVFANTTDEAVDLQDFWPENTTVLLCSCTDCDGLDLDSVKNGKLESLPANCTVWCL